MGALPVHVLHARDTEADLQAAFKTLLADCDLVVSVGGVSVGERDLVKPALASLGGELALWKVRMKPGKPVALAQIDGKPVVGLPGNPVSAYAVFTLLVTPLMRRMQGRDTLFPPTSLLPLRTEHPRQDSREEFLRVQRRRAFGFWRIDPDSIDLLLCLLRFRTDHFDCALPAAGEQRAGLSEIKASDIALLVIAPRRHAKKFGGRIVTREGAHPRRVLA